MKNSTITRIGSILEKCIQGAINRTAKNLSYRPFHEALLSKEIVSASAFERSFSTSFGQGPIEEISQVVAEDNGYLSERQKSVQVNVYKGAIDEIERICSGLRGKERTPDWDYEVERVLAYQKGDTEVRRVISDLRLQKGEEEIFISIKTVKPNLDQTEKAKKDMLLLKAHNPDYKTFFGLYYNPGGERQADYNWSVPSKIFDMQNDTCVLIGRQYWDMIGGVGTYDELLKVFEIVGQKTRDLISKL